MALEMDYAFAFYELADPGTPKKIVWSYTGSYDPAGLEPDSRPEPGSYDAAVYGWMAVPNVPVAEVPDALDGAVLQEVQQSLDTTTGAVTATAQTASLKRRQRKVMATIANLARDAEWTQRGDARLTQASRLAFAKYLRDLAAIETDQAATWSSNPEGISWPTVPTLAVTAKAALHLTTPLHAQDAIEDDWVFSGGTSSAISYPTATGQTGSRVLRVTGAGATVGSTQRVRWDATRLYRVTARVRRVGAAGTTPGTLYLGVSCRDANDAATGVMWCTAKAVDQGALVQDAWTTYTGYVCGEAAQQQDGAGTILSPSKADAGSSFLAARAAFNYTSAQVAIASGSSTMELDYLDIQAVDPKIVMDQILEAIPRTKLAARASYDFLQTVALGPFGATTTLTEAALLDIGAIGRGNVYTFCASFEGRNASGTNLLTVKGQYRYARAGNPLSAWIDHVTFGGSVFTTTYDMYEIPITFGGGYDDLEYRIVYSTTSGSVFNVLRNVYLTAVRLTVWE